MNPVPFSFTLSPRLRVGVDRFQATADMGINFRRYDTSVAEESLNYSQVGAIFQHVTCGLTRFLMPARVTHFWMVLGMERVKIRRFHVEMKKTNSGLGDFRS